MKGKRVFIHHEGALGDVLLSYPCIRAIKKQSDFVHMAGKHDVVEFLRETGSIDEASSSDRTLYASLYSSSVDPMSEELLARFDAAFVFTKNGDSVLSASIRAVIPRTEAVITFPPKGYPMHVGEFRIRQITEQMTKSNETLFLDIPFFRKERALEFLRTAGYRGQGRTLVALHPGSGGKKKRWPLENYFSLIERIKSNLDPFFLIVTGPAEDHGIKEKTEVFVRGQEGMIHVCDEGLGMVAALLSLSHIYIGNDSGITHLSSGVNGNVVALFGPTEPFLWRPMGQGVRIISSGSPNTSLLSITVDEVLAAVTDSISILSRGKT